MWRHIHWGSRGVEPVRSVPPRVRGHRAIELGYDVGFESLAIRVSERRLGETKAFLIEGRDFCVNRIRSRPGEKAKI